MAGPPNNQLLNPGSWTDGSDGMVKIQKRGHTLMIWDTKG